jgi:hypothetical protein
MQGKKPKKKKPKTTSKILKNTWICFPQSRIAIGGKKIARR